MIPRYANAVFLGLDFANLHFIYPSMINRIAKHFFCARLFTSSYISNSQSVVDSLTLVIDVVTADEDESIAYYEASSFVHGLNQKRGLSFAPKGLSLAKDIGFDHGIIKNTINIGEYHFDQESLVRVLKTYLIKKDLVQISWECKDIYRFNMNVGLIYGFTSNLTESFKCYLNCFYLASSANNTLDKGKVLNYIEGIYSHSNKEKISNQFYSTH